MKAYIVELIIECPDDDKPNEWDWDNLLDVGGGVTVHKLKVDETYPDTPDGLYQALGDICGDGRINRVEDK